MIRWLLNTLGLLFFLVTLAVVGNEVWHAITGPFYRIVPLGELWASLHANSLVGLQAKVEAASHLLWRAIALPILLGPAWAVPLGLAILFRLLAAFAPRRARLERKPAKLSRRRRRRATESPDQVEIDSTGGRRKRYLAPFARPRIGGASPDATSREAAPEEAQPPAARQPTVVRRS